jgi:hypothetical protein
MSESMRFLAFWAWLTSLKMTFSSFNFYYCAFSSNFYLTLSYVFHSFAGIFCFYICEKNMSVYNFLLEYFDIIALKSLPNKSNTWIISMSASVDFFKNSFQSRISWFLVWHIFLDCIVDFWSMLWYWLIAMSSIFSGNDLFRLRKHGLLEAVLPMSI